ncbi:hypothetical protein [Devosia sp. BK]|nr:hypothetical protein [Devosia sp. BK]
MTTKTNKPAPKTTAATDELPDAALDKVAGGNKPPEDVIKGRV